MCSSIALWITSNVRKYCQRENIFLTSSYLNATFYYSIRMLHCINLKMHFIYGSDVFFWHVFIYEPLGSSHDGDIVVICSQTSTSIGASLIPLKDFVFSLILFPWYTENVKSSSTLLLRSQQHRFQLCMHVPLPWLAVSTASNKSLCQHLHANMKMLT